MNKSLLSYICLIIIVGCSAFSTPDNSSVPNDWHSQDRKFLTTESNLPYLAWWEKFNDPTLNYLIESGLKNNNTIQISMANVEVAEGQLKQVELGWIPSLSTNVGYSSFPDLGFPGALFAVIPTYTINIFQQIKQQKQAKYQLEAARAEDDGIRLAIIGQIASSYFAYIAQTEQLKLFLKLEDDLKRINQIALQAYNGGITSQVNVMQTDNELKLINAQIDVIKHNLVVSQNALSYLLNQNPGKIKLTREFSELDGSQVVVGSLPLNVIENRPDMIQAANELKASNEGIGVAFSNLLPTVQLSMARGQIGNVANSTQFGQPIYFNQALLQIPIFNASVYGQLDSAKGLNKASYYKYTDTLRKVLRDVDNDLSAHDMYTKRYTDTVSAMNSVEKAYQLNLSLYNRGIISNQVLLDYQVRLDNANILVNKSRLDQFITIVNLYQDLAGGYKHEVESEHKN